MTYAGLTISDKPALLDAKARGAEMESAEKPRTVASVLLERYQNNIEAFASSRVVGKIVNGRSKFYCSQSEVGFDVLADAINAEIAYLNSAAEVGK